MNTNATLTLLLGEVQQRHNKRVLKIMEQLMAYPQQAKLLEALVQEEFEKRNEDYNKLMSGVPETFGPTKTRIADILFREITDDTVVHFLQRKLGDLKALFDVP